MEFYTSSSKKRPVRLSESTRAFACESLDRKYGLDTRRVGSVSLAHITGYPEMAPLDQYDRAITEIVKSCPIRICTGEKISGAATLGDAIDHVLPALYDQEPRDWYTGVSHLTADFSEVLRIGMNGIRQKAEISLKNHREPEKRRFLKSCLHAIDCMKLWHSRYLDALSAQPEYAENYRNLQHVPFEPARNFYEAVQSIWFCFAFLRLCGCWPGIGRLDVLLGGYLKKDLADGTLDQSQAREILAHFFIKGCEWIDGGLGFGGSGDAQHYQNIVLSGIDENGVDVTNEVTYLVLEIVEETGIGDFPITVRINRKTDPKLLRRIAEVMQYGGGVLAVYNEELILAALTDMGYETAESRRFANDGCWEVQIPGKTNFFYVPFDALRLLQHQTLRDYDGTAEFDSFEALLQRFEADLAEEIALIYENNVQNKFLDDRFRFQPAIPCTVIALFEQDCITRGLSYREGGAVYNVISPHIGGLPDVANSLYAIRKLVFEEKRVSFSRLMDILKNNWKGEEALRLYAQRAYLYYGNDNDEVDGIAAQILNDFSDLCRQYDGKTPIRFISGVSTFGRQIAWAPGRFATPFGRKAGEILSGNLSPTPGSDQNGVTAIIKSYCKADLRKQHSGAALDLSFMQENLDHQNATDALVGILQSFIALGGFFLQLDTASRETLLAAQQSPENYKNLAVRVSGWNARFVTLNKEWQDMIIER